jgi:glucan 1,3-beta-glucosidase
MMCGCSLGNAFAYWQGSTIQNASNVYFDDMNQAINHVRQIAGNNAKNIHFLNGETGWPTGMTP